MKEVNVILFGFAVVGIAIFSVVVIAENGNFNPRGYFLSERALTADYHLAVARGELARGQKERCIKEINKAIRDLEYVKKVTDSEGVVLANSSIDHLNIVIAEIENDDEVVLSGLVEASIESLNTLAVIQLKMVKQLIEDQELEKALTSMEISTEHLKNAMIMASTSNQQDLEKYHLDQVNLMIEEWKENGVLDEKVLNLTIDDLKKLIDK